MKILFFENLKWTKFVFASMIILGAMLSIGLGSTGSDHKPVPIGTDRELLIDDYLIASSDQIEQRYYEPVRQRETILMDRPWEGHVSGFATILYDDLLKIYRFYYKSSQTPLKKGEAVRICVMESRDGIHWKRPNLGLVEFQGSKDNNILFLKGHDFTPFLDKNPNATKEGRYKAASSPGAKGIWIWQSPDGIHWSKISKDFVFTKGNFDSQNVIFWSEMEKKYILYYRIFLNHIRTSGRAVSDDAIHWKNEGPILWPKGRGPNFRVQHYTNQIQPYYRAPQIYLGFPSRYIDNGLTESTRFLPDWEKRKARIEYYAREKIEGGTSRFGTAVTDCFFISGRNGRYFEERNIFVRPGLRTSDNWAYIDNYITYGFLELDSLEKDSPRELSFYASESSRTDKSSIFRRYTLRIDGFGSLSAKKQEGSFITKPLLFEGKELSLNYRTTAAGLIFVEVCDLDGKPLPGFSRKECDPIYGDSLDRRVSWKKNRSLATFLGKPVVLKFYMSEADLFSLKFEKTDK